MKLWRLFSYKFIAFFFDYESSKNKTWLVYKKYYLLSHVFVLIIGLISVFYGYYENNLIDKGDLVASTLVFIIMTLLGIYDHIKYEVFRKKCIKNQLNDNLFYEFKKKGYRLFFNEYRGKYKDYTVSVGIEYEAHHEETNYYLKVLFHPKSLNRYLTFDEYIIYNDKENNGFYVNLDSVEKSYSKQDFFSNSIDEFYEQLDNMVLYLKMKKLNPIGFDSLKQYSSEIRKVEDEYLEKI